MASGACWLFSFSLLSVWSDWIGSFFTDEWIPPYAIRTLSWRSWNYFPYFRCLVLRTWGITIYRMWVSRRLTHLEFRAGPLAQLYAESTETRVC